jgi:hypothetical protein
MVEALRGSALVALLADWWFGDFAGRAIWLAKAVTNVRQIVRRRYSGQSA